MQDMLWFGYTVNWTWTGSRVKNALYVVQIPFVDNTAGCFECAKRSIQILRLTTVGSSFYYALK